MYLQVTFRLRAGTAKHAYRQRHAHRDRCAWFSWLFAKATAFRVVRHERGVERELRFRCQDAAIEALCPIAITFAELLHDQSDTIDVWGVFESL